MSDDRLLDQEFLPEEIPKNTSDFDKLIEQTEIKKKVDVLIDKVLAAKMFFHIFC